MGNDLTFVPRVSIFPRGMKDLNCVIVSRLSGCPLFGILFRIIPHVPFTALSREICISYRGTNYSNIDGSTRKK